MEKQEECVCCQEIIPMTDKLQQLLNHGRTQQNIPGCITEHPGFNEVCLGIWGLQTAYFNYRQHNRKNFRNNESDHE